MKKIKMWFLIAMILAFAGFVVAQEVSLEVIQSFNYSAGLDNQIQYADFDGDGDLDMFAKYNDGSGNAIGIWLADAGQFSDTVSCKITLNETFGLEVIKKFNYSAGLDNQVRFADVNGDGAIDMVAKYSSDGPVVGIWLQNDGIFPDAPNSVIKIGLITDCWLNVGDFNGDDKADVAMMSSYSSYHAPKIVWGQSVMPDTIVAADLECTYPVDADYTQLGNYTCVVTGDFNADGFDDLIFPDQGTKTSTGDYGGRAVMYLGGESMTGDPDTVLSFNGSHPVAINDSQHVFLRWFSLMFDKGDFNNDGYDDIFTAGYYSYSDIFLTSAVSGNVEQMHNIGAGVIYLGGPDFDNIPDVIMVPPDDLIQYTTVGEYMYAGYRVHNAGDVNGDGIDDVSLPAWYWDVDVIYYGMDNVSQATSIDSAVIIREPGQYYTKGRMNNNYYLDQHGANLVSIGDVNNDGYDDLGNVKDYFGTGPEDPGIRLFWGSALKSGAITFDFETGDYIRIAPSNVDLDGDEMVDMVAHDTNSLLTLLKYKKIVPSDNAWFNVGDFNNDGMSDVAVMSTYGTAHAPKVVWGRESVPAEISAADLECTYPVDADYTQLGNYTCVVTGDFNADGFDDLIFPDQGTKTSTGDYGGRAVMYLGGESMTGDPDTVLSFNGSHPVAINDSQHVFLRWFSLMFDKGDFNNDGYDDIFTAGYYSYSDIFLTSAASGNVEQMLNIGAGVIYLGGPDFDNIPDVILVPPDDLLKHTTVGEYMYAGYRVHNAGDVNGDGIDDVSLPAWYWDVDMIYYGMDNVTQAGSIDDAVIVRDPGYYYTKGRFNNGSYLDQHGAILVPVGDVDGDGYADLGNIKDYYGTGPDDPGIRLFWGSADKSDSVGFDYESSDFIKVFASNIDFDGDGNADLVVHDANSLLTLLKVKIDTTTSVQGQDLNLPDSYALFQNYPNPFNAMTKITYALPQAAKVDLKIYDITGRLVETVISGFQSPGIKSVTLDASEYATGIYFYRLNAGNFTAIRKFVMIKYSLVESSPGIGLDLFFFMFN